ncbi:MAG: hypothetical protein HC918_00340 [Oscillatoriales cyanobacterium SM2_1_8]|nr:hypothetical protein [Oscillatoriales cyanobacterium SM2_1_8]
MGAIGIKLSTTAIVLGVLWLAQSPAGTTKPADAPSLSHALQAMVGLTTHTVPAPDTPPANWQPVADRGLAKDCLQNLDSGAVLCATNPGLPQPWLAQPAAIPPAATAKEL